MKTYIPFCKVLAIKVELFESTIIDERHFGTEVDAMNYAEKMREIGYITVVINM